MFTRGSNTFVMVSKGYTHVPNDKYLPQCHYYELYHSSFTMSYTLRIYLKSPCTYSFRTCRHHNGWRQAGRYLYRNVDIAEARRKQISVFERLDVNACVDKWVQGLRIWEESCKY